jgi:hypothetical protein
MKEKSASREVERTGAEAIARVLLLLAGGTLLSILVSCACGPIR